MSKNGNGYTAAECIKAAEGSKGYVTNIANILGCSRSYVYKLQKKFPTFATAIYEEREGNKDFAESKLMMAIDAGNIAGIIFYLKTQAKDRGYVEKQEIEHSGELKVKGYANFNPDNWDKDTDD